MATLGKLPIRGFKAGSVSPVITKGFHAPGVTPPDPPVPYPNLSIGTAIELTLPAEITIDLSKALITGAWYKYTAKAEDYYLGMHVIPPPAAPYFPRVFIYNDLSLTPNIIPSVQTDAPKQFPVEPENTYYFQFINGGGSPPAGTNYTFQLRAAASSTATVGSIFIPDDTPFFRGLLLNALTGDVLRAVDFPAGEAGDILPSGIMCVEAEDSAGDVVSVQVFTAQFELISSTTVSRAQCITADQTSRFYFIEKFGDDQVYAVGSNGVVVSPAWTLPTTSIATIAANVGGSLLYWSDTSTIARYDLENSVVLSNLSAAVSGFTCRELLVLADNTLLSYYSSNAVGFTTDFIRHFSAAGVILHDYAMSSYLEERFDHFTRDPNGASSFWLWTQTPAVQTSTFTHITTANGAIISDFSTDNFNSGIGPTGSDQFFGPSKSCPFFLLTQSLAPPVGAACVIDFPLG